MMSERDANRIPKMLAVLSELWLANPHLRLGQIISNAAITFYVEDDKALKELEAWRDHYAEARTKYL